MQKRYPFKYLDAYIRDDIDFYFGRDEEKKQLYEMTFQSDFLLVFGPSGAGKTSLIQCGLASCFEEHEWLALTIRRGDEDINISLIKELKKTIGSDIDYIDDWETDNDEDYATFDLDKKIKTVQRYIKAVRLIYFKPVFLIFDQFEELYVLGKSDEQSDFYEIVRKIRTLNQPIKFIITIREEYLGNLYDFEKKEPDIFQKKLRIAPMMKDKIYVVLRGINNHAESLVTLQEGEEDRFIERIFDILREGKISIELPYLQVLLDKIYRDKTQDVKHKPTTSETLNLVDLEPFKNIDDIISYMLNGLVLQLEKDGIDTETVWKILSFFVTDEGTKKPLPATDLNEKDQKSLVKIANRRILRFDENRQVYEIAHDSMAKQIYNIIYKENKGKIEMKKMLKKRFTFIATVFGIIMSVLSMFTYMQRNIAISQREIANKAKVVADSLRQDAELARDRIEIQALIADSLRLVAEKAKEETEKEKENAFEARNNANNALKQKQLIEFEDLSRRAEVINRAGGSPKEILMKMEEIAKEHPDRVRMQQIIKKFK